MFNKMTSLENDVSKGFTISFELPSDLNSTNVSVLPSAADTAVEHFRRSQYHYEELDVLFIVGLYTLVFLAATTGNSLILCWISPSATARSGHPQKPSLFRPFLANLCLSDHLVLFSCCPLMVYAEITAFWYLGATACTTIHYFQAVAVTSSTLSMASVSLMRFLLIRFPAGTGNQQFHRRLKVAVLSGVWLLSTLTAIPIIFVRRQGTVTVAGTTFDFCIEVWDSDLLRTVYSSLVFSVVYATPCLVLTYCQLKVGYLIKAYERQKLVAAKRNQRSSFNRRGFRVRGSQASETSGTSINSLSSFCKEQASEHYDQNIVVVKKLEKRLNQKRKRLSRLIIWTTFVFVICWLPYNLVSLYLDVQESEVMLSILPFTLLLGHCHSAVNPFVYWLLNKKRTSASRHLNEIEMRCELMRVNGMSVYSVEDQDRFSGGGFQRGAIGNGGAQVDLRDSLGASVTLRHGDFL